MYGSSRLGIYNYHQPVPASPLVTTNSAPTLADSIMAGSSTYEITNHLGNVLAVLSDKKIGVTSSSDSSLTDHYIAEVINTSDYYAFGMGMPGRSYRNVNLYRYGFNGKEKDKDISEGGQDYGMRIYDTRLSRFLSVDPITKKYPELTPYQFASNRPIDGIDLDGAEYHTTGKYFSTPDGMWRVNTDVKISFTNSSKIITNVKTIESIKTSIKSTIEKDQSGGKGTQDDPIVTTKIVEDNAATIKINLVDAVSDPKTKSVTTGYTYKGIGQTQANVTDVSVTVDGKPRAVAEISRTASHEQGHVGGLKHPFHGAPETDIGGTLGPLPTWRDNLMNSFGGSRNPGDKDYNPLPSTTGHDVSPQQRKTIRTQVENQQPDKPKQSPVFITPIIK